MKKVLEFLVNAIVTGAVYYLVVAILTGGWTNVNNIIAAGAFGIVWALIGPLLTQGIMKLFGRNSS